MGGGVIGEGAAEEEARRERRRAADMARKEFKNPEKNFSKKANCELRLGLAVFLPCWFFLLDDMEEGRDAPRARASGCRKRLEAIRGGDTEEQALLSLAHGPPSELTASARR